MRLYRLISFNDSARDRYEQVEFIGRACPDHSTVANIIHSRDANNFPVETLGTHHVVHNSELMNPLKRVLKLTTPGVDHRVNQSH